MKRLLLSSLLCLIWLSVEAGAAQAVGTQSSNLLEIGRRIYQEGIVGSGEPLQGEGAAKVIFSGNSAACIHCHRKSGLGSGEGRNVIRPITGEYIFPKSESDIGAGAAAVPTQATLRQRALAGQANAHAAYTSDAFARALRKGVDFNGKPLDRLMPRYTLSDGDVAALAAYLKTLSAHPDPGVDQTTIHFATVILPDVEQRKSQAMLDVLQAFFTDKNSDSRSEGRRRSAGTEAMYRAYRQWKLHIWRLTGPAESWQAQLEERYRQQPVFALLSGIGNASWRPLHQFCESQRIPCLFPNNDLPVTEGAYYSFYFSRGMALEAAVLARQFRQQTTASRRIVQVFRKGDSLGETAAQQLRDGLQGDSVDIVDWPYADHLDVKSFQQMLTDQHPATLVIWVSDTDLSGLRSWQTGGHSPQQIYLSASMLGGDLAVDQRLSAQYQIQFLDRVRLVYPFELPPKAGQRLQRTRLWLKAKNIPLTAERVQANTYFAATVAGDAVSHLLHHFSRDYFIERIEHMITRSMATSVYPPLSLGPGQRFASKGAYLVKYSLHPGQSVEPVSEWIVP